MSTIEKWGNSAEYNHSWHQSNGRHHCKGSTWILLNVYSFYFIFKLYFIDYAITVVLIFSPLPPSTQHYPLPQTIPHHCSSPRVIHISSLATLLPILYFTSLWLFSNYLFVLNPLTSSHIPLPLHPIWQPSKRISWMMQAKVRPTCVLPGATLPEL